MAHRVFFYLNSGTHILDLAGAVQVFHEATKLWQSVSNLWSVVFGLKTQR
jgi:hypothetical protein